WSAEAVSCNPACPRAAALPTRLAAAAGPVVAANGPDPSEPLNPNGAVSVLQRAAGAWTSTAVGPEEEQTEHPCETLRPEQCAVSPGLARASPAGVFAWMPIAVLVACAARRRRARNQDGSWPDCPAR